MKKYWMGDVGTLDDFGVEFVDEFVDGGTKYGPWANMTPASWKKHGIGRLGLGYGQRYKKQSDGRWLFVIDLPFGVEAGAKP